MRMKQLILGLIGIIACVSATACTDKLESRIDGIEDRLDRLEEIVNQLNSDISSLKGLLDGTLFIGSVTDNQDGSYTITFVDKDGNPVSSATVSDGQDGSSSEISVKMDSDGKYYWVLNGEWMLDEAGNKVPVSGEDGITPMFKIVEDYWYISYDGGLSWDIVGRASGEFSGNVFTDVILSEDGSKVTLVLSDGSEFSFELFGTFDIVFEGVNGWSISAGSTLEVPFEIVGVTDGTVVEALPAGLWKAEVQWADRTSGVIAVTSPENETEGKVVVLASDGGKQTRMRTLTFKDGFLTVASSVYPVSGRGGVLEIPITTNLDFFRVSVDCDWIKYDSSTSTKAPEHNETMTFSVDANETAETRSAVITVKTTKNVELQSILVTQMSNDVTDLSADGTANCYIVPAAGAYKFSAATMGNSATAINISNPAADYLWVDGSSTQNLLIGDVEYSAEDKCIYFLATGNMDGNAVIVLYDSETMKVAYSWHIWFVNGGVKDITAATSGSWMDRNLGAVGYAKEDEWKAYGLLWQWGRKDPFIGSDVWMFANSAQGGKEGKAFDDMTAPNYVNPVFAESHGWWSQSNSSQFETIDASLAFPMRFVCRTAGDGVWTDEQVLYTWRTADGSKGVYDPCPAGYHVPSYSEFADAQSSGSLAYDIVNGGEAPYLGQSINNGAYYNGNGADNETWLPAVPYRGTGAAIGKLLAFGYYGTYWTSTTDDYEKESGTAYKYNSYVSGDMLKFSSKSRSDKAGAYTIRCKRDDK